MENIIDFARALGNTHLGGLMEGCVVRVKDEKALILCMDKSASLFVSASADIGFPDGEYGIGDLSLFSKYMGSIKDRAVAVKCADNKITFKPAVGSTLHWVLTEVDFIPTYDAEWEDDLVEDELRNFSGSLVLGREAISELTKSMSMFGPNSIVFNVSKKGVVKVTGGAESEHHFEYVIGTADEIPECSIQVLSKNIMAVLNTLTFEEVKPLLYLSAEDGIIVVNADASWILQPIVDSEFNEDDEDGDYEE